MLDINNMAARAAYKLFVGNLPWTVGHRELRMYFSEFGPVASAIVIFDKNTGLSRGYGFVVLGNKSGFSKVTNKQTHVLEGNQITVQAASH